MTLRLDIHISTLYNGCRSVYAAVQVGRRTWFVQRWDNPRIGQKYPVLYRGRAMSWNIGSFAV